MPTPGGAAAREGRGQTGSGTAGDGGCTGRYYTARGRKKIIEHFINIFTMLYIIDILSTML